MKKVKRLKKQLTRVCLAEVMHKLEVEETFRIEEKSQKFHVYKIRFHFLPHEYYREEKCLRPERVLRFMETRFIRIMFDAIKRRSAKLSSFREVSTRRAAQKDIDEVVQGNQQGQAEENDEDAIVDADADEGDADATDAKRKEKQEEEVDYESEEEESQANEEDQEDEEGPSTNPGEETVGITEETEDTTLHSLPSQSSQGTQEKLSKDVVAENRINDVLSLNPSIEDYSYDTQNSLWCEVRDKCLCGPIQENNAPSE
ncbi:hypothetical protein GDO86_003209 [Hymenochirus boettgeri]|uniref:Uncharacterized protein n=1 Tax=Hymenochirus boettgeri TaxID=247094 RepID=A0A8T2K478_9PIPI|nr:hypothetical protein GDO86_003209 [Hymenochirus boettgeri]